MNLPPHWTTNKHDSTKLAIFARCPREWFFHSYVGWQPDTVSHHLLVGQCFHKGMEVLLAGTSGPKATRPKDPVGDAQRAYLKAWAETKCVAELGAKSPDNVCLALREYYDTYAATERWAPVAPEDIEVPGIVSIGAGRVLYVNLDGVVVDENMHKLFVIDHKTMSAEDQLFAEKWQLSFQMTAYIHTLCCIRPIETVGGAIVNGIILRKPKTEKGKGNAFVRCTIQRTTDQMEAWLGDVNSLFDEIEWNTQLLAEDDEPHHAIMRAFPRRTWHCERYARMCPYHGVCSGCANPLRLIDRGFVPAGMERRWWDPEAHEQTTAIEPPTYEE